MRILAMVFALFCLFMLLLTSMLRLYNMRTPAATDIAQSALLRTPPEPLAKPITLKVLTFNIQATPVVGRNRTERMRALGKRITELDPDIVGFQEAFIEKNRRELIAALSGSRLRHHQYFESATVGSGLLLSSAYPIVENHFHRFTKAGDWYRFYEGDWMAGKGVALSRITLPGGLGYADVYNTHAQAGYGNPKYDVVRVHQMREMASFIVSTRSGTSPVLVMGDLNCRIGQPDHQALVEGANLVRAMNIPSSIDHVYFGESSHYDLEIVNTIEIPAKGLSDHNGYLSELRIVPAAG